MIVVHCQQASDEWWEHKRAVPSASNFHRIVTSTGKLSKQSDGYIAELIAEVASFNPKFFTTRGTEAMRNGQTTEPEARRFYEMERGVDVEQVGVCFSDDERFCCSPDGLVEPDGGLELKCPSLPVMAEYLMDNRLPLEHKAQVHGCLIVTGRAWWDYLAYAPGLKPLLIRVEPDEYTETLRVALDDFWERLQDARALIHPPTKEEEQVKAWKRWLRQCADDLAEVNKGLPLMAALPLDVRRETWRLSELHGKSRGWIFDRDTKQFRLAEQPAF
jgi:hypothetical protein